MRSKFPRLLTRIDAFKENALWGCLKKGVKLYPRDAYGIAKPRTVKFYKNLRKAWKQSLYKSSGLKYRPSDCDRDDLIKGQVFEGDDPAAQAPQNFISSEEAVRIGEMLQDSGSLGQVLAYLGINAEHAYKPFRDPIMCSQAVNSKMATGIGKLFHEMGVTHGGAYPNAKKGLFTLISIATNLTLDLLPSSWTEIGKFVSDITAANLTG